MSKINTRKEWLEYRRLGIGASDAPIVMGLSPWMTPLQLWEQKTADTVEEWEGNYATKLGDEAEPKIRSLFELQKGQSFEPALVESAEFPFIRASLDGWTEDKKTLVEIKLLNKKDWDIAKQTGKVPDKYYCQIQHQLIASQAESCFFAAYLFQEFKLNRKKNLSLENLIVVEVFPDKKYQGNLIECEMNFWNNHVLKRKPPTTGSKDVVELNTIDPVVKWYLEVKENHDELSKILAKAESELKELAEASGHDTITSCGLKLAKVSRAGSFSVSKAEEVVKFTKEFADKLTPTERAFYTGKGSAYWKITMPKKEKKEE